MATFQEVDSVRPQAWDEVQSRLHMRPRGVGVTRCGEGYGLKVVLPRAPDDMPPAFLLGVPVTYDVDRDGPRLLGSAPAWRRKLDQR
jgi:hypothetical protein